MVELKFNGKRYIVNTDRLLFNVTILVLLVVFIVGACYVSNQDFATEVMKSF